VKAFAQVEVSPELIARGGIDVVAYAERELRERIRREHGDEAAERGRVVWTARLEVEIDPTERK